MLSAFPAAEGYEREFYALLRRDLLHCRYVYTASYAALPHRVETMTNTPDRVNWCVPESVTRIEITLVRVSGPARDEVQAALHCTAMDRLPEGIAAMVRQRWDERFTHTAAAALAASTDQHTLPEAILELKPGQLKDFRDTVADDA